MEECKELYGKVPSPGDSISTNVYPFDVANDILEDGEIQSGFRGLNNSRTTGTSYMCAWDLRAWLYGMEE